MQKAERVYQGAAKAGRGRSVKRRGRKMDMFVLLKPFCFMLKHFFLVIFFCLLFLNKFLAFIFPNYLEGVYSVFLAL